MAISKISPEDFVRAWQSADSPKDVMEATSLSYAAVARRAHDYRKMGIKLKFLIRQRRTIDVDALNKICESIKETRDET